MSLRANAEAFVPFEPGSVASAAAGRPLSVVPGLKVESDESPSRGDAQKNSSVSPRLGVSGPPTSPFSPFPAASAHAHGHPPGAGQPVVTLQREGERVTGIRVECACGQVIELACSY